MPRRHGSGFVLIDTLIALLLLAVGLLGACAALVQAVRATQAAWLGTRAVDLTADLSEGLNNLTSVPQRQHVLQSWRDHIEAELPTGSLPEAEVVSWRRASPDLAASELSLRWHSTDDGATRELRLPVAVLLPETP